MRKLVILFIAMLFVSIGLYILFWSGKFSISATDITPTWIERQEIISIAEIKLGKNMFFYRTDLAENTLRNDPRIESAIVTKHFPHTIHVELIVREPFVTIVDGANSITLDRSGLVIEVNEPKRTEITLHGYRLSKVSLGETLISQDAAALKKALDLSNLISQTALKQVNVFNEPSQLFLQIEDGFLVRFGTAVDMEKQFSAFMALYDYLTANGTSKGIIDVTNPEAAVFKPFEP